MDVELQILKHLKRDARPTVTEEGYNNLVFYLMEMERASAPSGINIGSLGYSVRINPIS